MTKPETTSTNPPSPPVRTDVTGRAKSKEFQSFEDLAKALVRVNHDEIAEAKQAKPA
jgi:hypothetical protein